MISLSSFHKTLRHLLGKMKRTMEWDFVKHRPHSAILVMSFIRKPTRIIVLEQGKSLNIKKKDHCILKQYIKKVWIILIVCTTVWTFCMHKFVLFNVANSFLKTLKTFHNYLAKSSLVLYPRILYPNSPSSRYRVKHGTNYSIEWSQ